jgi:hypothetical protein
MLVKASIFATVLICTVVGLSHIDFRELYNGMYPVNGLRRGVLTLCHQAEPTFVRAVESNRIGCYDSMPDPVELAIGWVRTSTRLAAMRRPTPVELAERLLVAAATERQIERPGEKRFTGYAMLPAAFVRPCEDAAKGLLAAAPAADLVLVSPDDHLARRLAGAETPSLAALGVMPRAGRATATTPAELPILTLGGAGNSGSPDSTRSMAAALIDPAVAADFGSDSALLLMPRTAAPGCKTPA